MSDFKKELLIKFLNQNYLNDFEKKKFKEYLSKINIMTYMMYEDRLEMLSPEYIKWCEIKIEQINYDLSKDKNIMNFINKKELYKKVYNSFVLSTSRTNKIFKKLDATKECI